MRITLRISLLLPDFMVSSPSSPSLRPLLLLLLPLVMLCSCRATRQYRQNILFRTDLSKQPDTLKIRSAVSEANSSYRIRPNDYLDVRVYTNEGERLIDPNGEIGFGSPSAPAGQSSSTTRTARIPQTRGNQAGGVQSQTTGAATDYLVQPDGTVTLPIIGRTRLSGFTTQQADSVLKARYNEYYRGPFIQTRVTNNRVIVLGTPGGAVIPMLNENMNLLEVLAAAGGIDGGLNQGGGGTIRGGRAYNIRLIRPEPDGTFDQARVEIIDLTTIEGMRKANLRMQPNDVVYIEPLRRPFFEALQDISPILGLIGSLAGLATTIIVVSKL